MAVLKQFGILFVLGSEGIAMFTITSVPLVEQPFLLKTDDNPEGADRSVFDDIMKAIIKDRPAYFSAFFKAFFNAELKCDLMHRQLSTSTSKH